MTTKKANKSGEGFWDVFRSLPKSDKPLIIDTICSEMGWGKSTFYSKRNGNRRLSKAEQALLKIIFAGYNIEL